MFLVFAFHIFGRRARDGVMKRKGRDSVVTRGGGARPPMVPLSDGMCLHIGGTEAREGWAVLNIAPGPGVDYAADCTDMTIIPSGTCREVYASHVLEHLGYDRDLDKALQEIHRILKPGGRLRVSVPDLKILCELFTHPSSTVIDQLDIMRMMFGSRANQYDIHHSGLTMEFMQEFLSDAGFRGIRRVREFGLFHDCSTIRMKGKSISLNIEAWRPAET